MQKGKVAHVTTIDMAVRFLLLNQLLYLKERGYEVSAVCSPGRWVPEVERAGIPIKTVEKRRRISPLADLVALWHLFSYFRKEGFVIVHAHTPKAGFLGQLAAKFAGVPIIVRTLHGFYFHDGMHPAVRNFFTGLEKIAALCSDSILSQNSEDIETAIREGICEEEKIKYLGNGIDINLFDPQRITAEEVTLKRREIGIRKDERVVGIVGRLVEEKGYLDFFQAARITKAKMPNIKFLVVGPIEREKRDALSPDVAKDYGLGDDVIFLGMRMDMPQLYAIMDVFVLPSHREGLPRTLMEAAAMAKPVVATDIRGCREVVKDGETGILVPVKDADALAEAILGLLQDPETAKKMGQAGRRRAEELFDERKVFQRVEAEYDRLLREKFGSRREGETRWGEAREQWRGGDKARRQE